MAKQAPLSPEEIAGELSAVAERTEQAVIAAAELIAFYTMAEEAEAEAEAINGNAWEFFVTWMMRGVTCGEMEAVQPELKALGKYRSAKSVHTKAGEFKIPLIDANGEIRARSIVYAQAQAVEAGISLTTVEAVIGADGKAETNEDGTPKTANVEKTAKTLDAERKAASKAENDATPKAISSPLAECSDKELAAVFFARMAADTAEGVTMRAETLQTLRVLVAKATAEETAAIEAAKAAAVKGKAAADARKAERAKLAAEAKAKVAADAAELKQEYKAEGYTVDDLEAAELAASELPEAAREAMRDAA